MTYHRRRHIVSKQHLIIDGVGGGMALMWMWAGDLVYLEVVTLEETVLTVTGSVDGFFVNRSKGEVFDPSPLLPQQSPAPTLVHLLKQAVGSFRESWARLMAHLPSVHQFELLPLATPSTAASTWLAAAPAPSRSPVPASLQSSLPSSTSSSAAAAAAVVAPSTHTSSHTRDAHRAEDSLMQQFGMDVRGPVRDWNEEYQSCKDMAVKHPSEAAMRDRTLHRLYVEFVQAATSAACGIVDGNIPPLNPTEPERSHIFLFNNIFFNPACDSRNIYEDCGGDATAYRMVKHDIKGHMAVANANVAGLHNLLICVVDFKGQRFICQSVIPGILHGEQSSTLLHGSSDSNKPFVSHPDFEPLFEQVGEKLHWRAHRVQDETGAWVTMRTPLDTKGLVGSDKRKYALELTQVMPKDQYWISTAASFDRKTVQVDPSWQYRPELITSYLDHVANLAVAKSDRPESTDLTTADSAAAAAEATRTPTVDLHNDDLSAEEEAVVAARTVAAANLRFTINAWGGHTIEELSTSTSAESDGHALLGDYLTQSVLPAMVLDLDDLSHCPVDGRTLTDWMHRRGVNMRYLGMLAQCLTPPTDTLSSPVAADRHHQSAVLQLVEEEMVVRAAKVWFTRVIQASESRAYRERHFCRMLTLLLNGLVGKQAGGHGTTEMELQTAHRSLKEDAETKSERDTYARAVARDMAQLMHDLQNPIGAHIPLPASTRSRSSSSRPSLMGLLTPSAVWCAVTDLVRVKFRHELSRPWPSAAMTADRRRRVLRNVCQQLGVQLLPRDWVLDGTVDPLTEDDIVGLQPKVTSAIPSCTAGDAYLDRARRLFALAQPCATKPSHQRTFLRQLRRVHRQQRQMAVAVARRSHGSASDGQSSASEPEPAEAHWESWADEDAEDELMDQEDAEQEAQGRDPADVAATEAQVECAVRQLHQCSRLLDSALSAWNFFAGPMHPQVGLMHSLMSEVCLLMSSVEVALDYEQRACLIYQRVHGGDDARTLKSASRLASMVSTLRNLTRDLEDQPPSALLTSNGLEAVALQHQQRALLGLRLIAGSTHPATICELLLLARTHAEFGYGHGRAVAGGVLTWPACTCI
jgi:protein TIF31